MIIVQQIRNGLREIGRTKVDRLNDLNPDLGDVITWSAGRRTIAVLIPHFNGAPTFRDAADALVKNSPELVATLVDGSDTIDQMRDFVRTANP